MLIAISAFAAAICLAEPPQATGGNWVDQGSKQEDIVGGTDIPDSMTNVPSAEVPLRDARPALPDPPGRGRRCPPTVAVPSCRSRHWDEGSCRIVCREERPGPRPLPLPAPTPGPICVQGGAAPPPCPMGKENVWVGCAWACLDPNRSHPKPQKCGKGKHWGYDMSTAVEGCTCNGPGPGGTGRPAAPACSEGTALNFNDAACAWECLRPEQCRTPLRPKPGGRDIPCIWWPKFCDWNCAWPPD